MCKFIYNRYIKNYFLLSDRFCLQIIRTPSDCTATNFFVKKVDLLVFANNFMVNLKKYASERKFIILYLQSSFV